MLSYKHSLPYLDFWTSSLSILCVPQFAVHDQAVLPFKQT